MDLFLIFAGGLLGSSHCVGMCGGFALAIGAQAGDWQANLVRQSVYTLGRLATYTLAGAMAGYAGLRLAGGLPDFVPTQAILALVARVFLIVQGLFATGLVSHRIGAGSVCLLPRLFSSFLGGSSKTSLFLAGVLTGLLPCGLVYAFLALASSMEDMLGGAIRMALFGLGTAPIMMLTGLGGSVLKLALRRRLLRAAGWCVVLAGVVSVWRGVEFLQAASEGHGNCPFCTQTDR